MKEKEKEKDTPYEEALYQFALALAIQLRTTDAHIIGSLARQQISIIGPPDSDLRKRWLKLVEEADKEYFELNAPSRTYPPQV